MAYTLQLFSGFSPPAIWIVLIAVIWAALWYFLGVPWVVFALPVVVLAFFQPPAEPGAPFVQALSLLLTLAGLPLAVWAIRKDFNKYAPEVALWATGLLMAPAFAWTSSASLYATYLATYHSLIALLALSQFSGKRAALNLCAFAVPAFILYHYLVIFTHDDDLLWKQTAVVTDGLFAGIHTTPDKLAFVEQIQGDLNECKKMGKSVLFYDQFPAGFLMSDLYPATRSLFMHTLFLSYKVRHIYPLWYSIPSNRPDCIFRMLKVPAYRGALLDNDPKKYYPAHDVFWTYLPEDSGEYSLFRQRDYYQFFVKTKLAPSAAAH